MVEMKKNCTFGVLYTAVGARCLWVRPPALPEVIIISNCEMLELRLASMLIGTAIQIRLSSI